MTRPATTDDIYRLERQIRLLQQTILQLVDGHQPDEILTCAETAEVLKVSERTLQRYVATKVIPSFRPSGKPKGDLRFYRSDVFNLANQFKLRKRRGKKPGKVRII